MMPQLYDKDVRINLLGPKENNVGPKEVMEVLMRPPFFPVAYPEVSSHVKCKGVEHPAGMVIVIHPDQQPTLITLEELEVAEHDSSRQLHVGSRRFSLSECLTIRMFRSNHPERTISYRLEERPTGKTMVFLTDHENTDGIPPNLRSHLTNADLLIVDAQYTREQYSRTAGFGHSTPDYCLRLAREANVSKLVLTHHDPSHADDALDGILAGLGQEGGFVSMAADDQVLEV